jgi:hypothetical protein
LPNWNATMSAIDLVAEPLPRAQVSVPIRTPRLELRPFSVGDSASIAGLLADPEATRWIGGVKTATEAAAFSTPRRPGYERKILTVDDVHHVVIPAFDFRGDEVLVDIEVKGYQRLVCKCSPLSVL